MAKFFIDRPIFAWVIAIILMLLVTPIMIWNIVNARREVR